MQLRKFICLQTCVISVELNTQLAQDIIIAVVIKITIIIINLIKEFYWR